MMADAPDDEEDEEQAVVSEDDDWGRRDTAPNETRFLMVIAITVLCLIAYGLWSFFSLCVSGVQQKPSDTGGNPVLLIIGTIVGVTTIAAIFMPLDED